MKKFISLVMVLAMMLTLLVGCGGNETAPATTDAPAAEVPATALEILEKVWADYSDDEKFAIVGGNIEAGIMDAPGSYDMAYAENMTYNLLIPAEQLSNITEAASMIHMMNANTFTCGVFRLAEGVAAADFGSAMQAAVQGNMWMCGFPETLLIKNIGDAYVLVAFGVNDAMGPFATHFNAVYPAAVTLVDEPIA